MTQTVEDIPELSTAEIAERLVAWRLAAQAFRSRYSYRLSNGQVRHANPSKQAELDGTAKYGEQLLKQRTAAEPEHLSSTDTPQPRQVSDR